MLAQAGPQGNAEDTPEDGSGDDHEDPAEKLLVI
jgi:hypothetical protein